MERAGGGASKVQQAVRTRDREWWRVDTQAVVATLHEPVALRSRDFHACSTRERFQLHERISAAQGPFRSQASEATRIRARAPRAPRAPSCRPEGRPAALRTCPNSDVERRSAKIHLLHLLVVAVPAVTRPVSAPVSSGLYCTRHARRARPEPHRRHDSSSSRSGAIVVDKPLSEVVGGDRWRRTAGSARCRICGVAKRSFCGPRSSSPCRQGLARGVGASSRPARRPACCRASATR